MAKMRVRYKGFSDRREMTAKQLGKVGIKVDKDLVFDRYNNFAMNIDLNDELQAILKKEGTFSITEIKDDGTHGEEVVKVTTVDDTANAATVVDGNTGQRSQRK